MTYLEEVIADAERSLQYQQPELIEPWEPESQPVPDSTGFLSGLVIGALLF